KSIHKYGAKLDGQNNQTACGFRTLGSTSFVEFNGFEIDGVWGSGVFLNNAPGSDFRVIGNHIHAIGRICPNTDSGLTGVLTVLPNTFISGNVFHDIGRFRNGENGCVTTVPPNHDQAIYLIGDLYGTEGASGAVMVNNVFFDITHGWPIQITKGSYRDIVID